MITSVVIGGRVTFMAVEKRIPGNARLTTFTRYLLKMRGSPRKTPLPTQPVIDVFVSWVGAFLGIATVAFLSLIYKMPLIVPSLGASAVLIYGAPDVPFAQPRNVFLGHVISATVGVVVYTLIGLTWWSAALATSLAIVMMLLTKTIHPPAGATALIAVLTKASPVYILAPVAAGALVLIIIGLIINNVSPNRSYPKYWL
jgi:CBS-domain-containing membrane protein